ncbi:MAG: T9SS type A sorting domain-containing protein, partial [candidate division Zixibacteria bacterium]|nr:T9SS type A sorting domain-containing protein [candidate division Zixibacteria bacterium]
RSYCGDHPNEICDSVEFQFTVTGMRLTDGADDWYLNERWFGDEHKTGDPTECTLNNAYPNPFNALTNITFGIPEASEAELAVYNLKGQRIKILTDSYFDAGYHTVTWDASDLSSGVYFYRLTAGDKVFTKRMTLLK